MSDDCVDQVRQIVADIFGVSVDDVTADSSPQSIESWDSMAHLNLVLSLEQAFGVNFAPEEIAELISVSAVVDRVRQKT